VAFGDTRIGDQHRALDPESLEFPARVGGGAGSELTGVASIVKIVS
jgi:hypothetical protein